jgi:hypothetical protein
MLEELEKQLKEKNKEFVNLNLKKNRYHYNKIFFEIQELVRAIRKEKLKLTLTDENAYS